MSLLVFAGAIGTLLTGLVEPPAADTQSAPVTTVAPTSPPTAGPVESEVSRRSRQLFIEAWELVRDQFYDPRLHAVDWSAIRAELEPKAAAARGRAAMSGVINDALGRLAASHTHHYTVDQREYYELLDVFYPEGIPRDVDLDLAGGPITYTGIGLAAKQIEGRWFAYDVYTGGPADLAGIHTGDELVAVEGSGGLLGPLGTVRRGWGDISPFRGRAGVPTTVIVQRTDDNASRSNITVTPERIQPRTMFLRALRQSARVLERNGHRLAYVRIRSYANPDYQQALEELLRTRFVGCEGLILDLRGGWGGAKPEYLGAFNPTGVAMDWRGRDDDDWRRGSAPWTGPLVVLIDEGTRSGKEVLAKGLQSHKRARLVGSPTAGAVLGGRPFILSDESLLLLAVSDVRVDGVRLEGVGVAPDVAVARIIPYSDGRDEQLDAGVRELLTMVEGRVTP
jgi:carboxyl-terminal processing protease